MYVVESQERAGLLQKLLDLDQGAASRAAGRLNETHFFVVTTPDDELSLKWRSEELLLLDRELGPGGTHVYDMRGR